MPVRSRFRRGFTLIEVMTAVVIVIILAALAVTYMVYGMGKARMNNTVFDVTAMINGAQLRAVSRGSPHYVFLYQTPDNRVHIEVIERPDVAPVPSWIALDMSQGPAAALAFTRVLEDGTTANRPAPVRDALTLGAGSGTDAGGIAFLDLDSNRIRKPLPAPFRAIAVASPNVNSGNLDRPTQNLRAGCNFCIDSSGTAYGVLRFNPDGTMDVLTGNVPSGAVIAFAPNTEDERGFTPKLLTVSAPAGATVVF